MAEKIQKKRAERMAPGSFFLNDNERLVEFTLDPDKAARLRHER